jgi:hypothetical protein
MKQTSSLIVLIISLLQACASAVPATELSQAHPAGRIEVISGETSVLHEYVETLTAESCLASPDNVAQARNEMKLKAYLNDADAVVRYQCRTVGRWAIPEGTVNCRICTGDAIKWK